MVAEIDEEEREKGGIKPLSSLLYKVKGKRGETAQTIGQANLNLQLCNLYFDIISWEFLLYKKDIWGSRPYAIGRGTWPQTPKSRNLL